MSIGCFLKFGKREHLETFEQGNLHFSPALTLRAREVDLQKGVGDRYEGGIEFANSKFQVTDSSGQTREANIKMDLIFQPLDEIPVFCITACAEDECIKNEDGTITLSVKPERLEWFKKHFNDYDSVAVIQNPNVFISDLEKAFPGCVLHQEIVYQDKEIKTGGTHPLDILVHLALKGEEPVPGKSYDVTVGDILNILFYKDTFFSLEHEYRFIVTDENRKITESKDFPVIMNSPVKIYAIDDLLTGGTIIC